MARKDLTKSGSEELRRRAETQLSSRPVDFKQLAPEECQDLLQELSIHQVELEMQNEQLRQTQADRETDAIWRIASPPCARS
jgi:hypothetical protein